MGKSVTNPPGSWGTWLWVCWEALLFCRAAVLDLHQQCRCKKFDTFCDKIIKGIDLSITVQKDSWAFFTAGQAPCGAGNLDVSSTSRACRWGWGCDGAPHSCRHLCGIAPPWQRQLTHGSGQRGQIPLLWESRKPQINYNSSKLQK